jgi:hypothetical protein
MRRFVANLIFVVVAAIGLVTAGIVGTVLGLDVPHVVARPRHVTTAPATTSPPVRLVIPLIGVDSALQPLGLLPDGSLQPPTAWAVAGWYRGGVIPGAVGPAVIIGHVDSYSGPAVFFRLRDLRPGDAVLVRRQDGGALVFMVDASDRYPKSHFPTAAVYGATATPVLRLITCTGEFDRSTGNYLDNLVVSAHLI